MSQLARANARKLLAECSITKPEHIDLEKIAAYKNIFIEECDIKSHAARIHKSENCGLIKISSAIKDEKQKNFVIAHEIGHFENERNKNIISCSIEDLLGLNSKKELERDANVFAAELLMKDEWVWDFTRGKIPGAKLIIDMSEYFSTSLLSAAIRYAEIGRHPAAVILSQDKKVKWSVINKDFTFKWLPHGTQINKYSYCYDYFNNGTMNTDVNKILADAWFLQDRFYRRNYFLYEQNIYLTNYNAVLSILWED
ncbi:ImmA/IrrE family metallo-endopeptidase [Melioribacter sp. OK-6-Me]|uniref:ImmA/IrrE family metallo-endopeptidase n=1 Tax=unclassified Melioribacter TaxID=2627329 RepID=UPI003ED90DF6